MSREQGNPWTRLNFSSDSLYEDPIYSVSQGDLQNTYYSTFYWEGSINYDRKFGRHSVSALVLFNQRENLKQTDYAYRTQGLVGRVTYDFGHKYLLEANIGYTGSEQFSPKNRYGFFRRWPWVTCCRRSASGKRPCRGGTNSSCATPTVWSATTRHRAGGSITALIRRAMTAIMPRMPWPTTRRGGETARKVRSRHRWDGSTAS